MKSEFEKKKLVDFINIKLDVVVDDNTLFFDDVGLNGLDVEIFMREFAEAFKVDLSNFDLQKYALSEYELGNTFLTIYRGLFNRKVLRKRSFRINHLCEVVKKGYWVDPVE